MVNSSSINMGFPNLAVIFIVLKLTDLIAWSWVWVLSPIWIGLALLPLIIGAIFLYEKYY